MSDRTGEVTDLEAPAADAIEQSLPVEEVPEDDPVAVLGDDLEVPEGDAIEQHTPAPAYDEDWPQ